MEDNSKSGGESQSAVGVIYKITNTLNGKPYVGKTKQKLDKRITQHKHNGRIGRPGIGAAIQKYGWENFTVEIIEECAIEKLDEREMFWIVELNSKAPNGYNLTDGGEGNSNPSAETRAKMSANHGDVSGEKNPNYGKKTSPETCAKISAANKGKPSPRKGKKNSEETRAKISANHADVSGENNPFYGKHHSEETCAKMSAAKKGKPRKPHSQETRDKIATSNKGKYSHNKSKPSPKKGKSLSAETCAKMSAAHKGKNLVLKHAPKLRQGIKVKIIHFMVSIIRKKHALK